MNVEICLNPCHLDLLKTAAGILLAVVFRAGCGKIGTVCDLVAMGLIENPKMRLRGDLYLLTATLTPNGRAIVGEWVVR